MHVRLVAPHLVRREGRLYLTGREARLRKRRLSILSMHDHGWATVMLVVGLAAFFGVLALLVVASTTRREAPTFAPTPIVAWPERPDTIVRGRVTIDTRGPATWR